jgi:WD40 repeat protein
VQVYDVATGQICAGCSYPVAGAEAVAWNQDGRELAVASNALEIVPLAATGHAIALSVPGAEQCGLDGAPEFSENDALVAWATRCGNVAVFTVEGKAVASFTAQGQPSAVAFNPAGTALAVSSWSGAVGIWNVRTGRRMFSLPNAPSGVSSIAYSRDGRYIVTTLLNDSAQVWDATSGQLARVDESSAPTLIAPVFDDEGDFATGDSTGTVKIWAECPDCEDARLLVGLAHRRVVSQLTPLERAAEG